MPVPRQISSSCGLAARVTGLNWEQLEEQLTAAGIQYDEVYLFASNGKPELLVGQRD